MSFYPEVCWNRKHTHTHTLPDFCELMCYLCRELALQGLVLLLSNSQWNYLCFLISSCMLNRLCVFAPLIFGINLYTVLNPYGFLSVPEVWSLEKVVWSKLLVSVGCIHSSVWPLPVCNSDSEYLQFRVACRRLVFGVMLGRSVLQGLCSQLDVKCLLRRLIDSYLGCLQSGGGINLSRGSARAVTRRQENSMYAVGPQ